MLKYIIELFQEALKFTIDWISIGLFAIFGLIQYLASQWLQIYGIAEMIILVFYSFLLIYDYHLGYTNAKNGISKKGQHLDSAIGRKGIDKKAVTMLFIMSGYIFDLMFLQVTGVMGVLRFVLYANYMRNELLSIAEHKRVQDIEIDTKPLHVVDSMIDKFENKK